MAFAAQVDARGVADGIDTFQQQAFEVLTSSRLATALDLSREDGRGRSRYGLDRAYPDEREGKTLPGSVPAGPAGDRSRRPLRHAGVQPLALRPRAARRPQLGLAPGPLPGGAEDPAAARSRPVGA